jgi:prolyl oligopeptidase PreP (S9A serine peptidase family)
MNIEELQAMLQEKIQKLDEERKANAQQQAKEREALLLDMDIERKQRLDEYQAKVAKLEARKKAEEEAKEVQRAKDTAVRVAEEQKQNTLDETLRLQREKLEWLTTAISNAEFSEEQHRRHLEDLRVLPPFETAVGTVSAEYPQTSASGGAAAEGTDGNTPETPLMSIHLKSILRQAQRD